MKHWSDFKTLVSVVFVCQVLCQRGGLNRWRRAQNTLIDTELIFRCCNGMKLVNLAVKYAVAMVIIYGMCNNFAIIQYSDYSLLT